MVLDFTRAETMVRFFDSDMLQLSTCSRCGGHFVAHAHDNKNGYVCVLCRPPSRAGKARKPKLSEVRRGGLVAVAPVRSTSAARVQEKVPPPPVSGGLGFVDSTPQGDRGSACWFWLDISW